jgi:hypothetical protein
VNKNRIKYKDLKLNYKGVKNSYYFIKIITNPIKQFKISLTLMLSLKQNNNSKSIITNLYNLLKIKMNNTQIIIKLRN